MGVFKKAKYQAPITSVDKLADLADTIEQAKTHAAVAAELAENEKTAHAASAQYFAAEASAADERKSVASEYLNLLP